MVQYSEEEVREAIGTIGSRDYRSEEIQEATRKAFAEKEAEAVREEEPEDTGGGAPAPSPSKPKVEKENYWIKPDKFTGTHAKKGDIKPEGEGWKKVSKERYKEHQQRTDVAYARGEKREKEISKYVKSQKEKQKKRWIRQLKSGEKSVYITPKGNIGTKSQLGVGPVRESELKNRGFRKVSPKSLDVKETEKGVSFRYVPQKQKPQEQKVMSLAQLRQQKPSWFQEKGRKKEAEGYVIETEEGIQFVPKEKATPKQIKRATGKKPEEITLPKSVVPSTKQRAWEESELSETGKKIAPFFGITTPHVIGKGTAPEKRKQMGQGATMKAKQTEQALIFEYKKLKSLKQREKAFESIGIAESEKSPKQMKAGPEKSLTLLGEFGKAVPRTIAKAPETVLTLPVSAYQATTRPVQTGQQLYKRAVTRPASFSGELVGNAIVFHAIAKVPKAVRGGVRYVRKVRSVRAQPSEVNIGIKGIKQGKERTIYAGDVELNFPKMQKGVKGKIKLDVSKTKTTGHIKIPKQKVGNQVVKKQDIALSEQQIMRIVGRKEIQQATTGKGVVTQEIRQAFGSTKGKAFRVRPRRIRRVRKPENLLKAKRIKQPEFDAFYETSYITKASQYPEQTGISVTGRTPRVKYTSKALITEPKKPPKPITGGKALKRGKTTKYVRSTEQAISEAPKRVAGKQIRFYRKGVYPNPKRAGRLLKAGRKPRIRRVKPKMKTAPKLRISPSTMKKVSPYIASLIGLEQEKKQEPAMRQTQITPQLKQKYRRKTKGVRAEIVLGMLPIKQKGRAPIRKTKPIQKQTKMQKKTTSPKNLLETPTIPKPPQTPKVKGGKGKGATIPKINIPKRRRMFKPGKLPPEYKLEWVRRRFKDVEDLL